MKFKIIHLTSAHPRYDTRIFYKMCIPLAKHDYDISLIVADGNGDEIKNGVSIFDVGKTIGGRFFRITKTTNRIFEKVQEFNADIYHLHDPELIPVGLKLKKIGKKVIFDVHEDYVAKMASKNWIYPGFRRIISFFFFIYYSYSIKKFDGVVLAANTIKVNNHKQKVFRNLPNLNFKKDKVTKKIYDNIVLYTGGLSEYRGIEQVIKALIQSEFRNWQLVILGRESLMLKDKLKNELEDKRIICLGKVSYDEVIEWISRSTLGVVINQPVFTYDKALPNKLFEYMAYGLPVVCSNFPHWQEIVVKNNAGISCNPTDLDDIEHSIKEILLNQKLQKTMSENGKKTINNLYNLEKEIQILIEFYKEIIDAK